MSSEKHDQKTPNRGRAGGFHRWLLHGESAVASLGMAVAAILVAMMGFSGYWLMRQDHEAARHARQQQIATAGDVLAGACQRLLATGNLSAARGLIVEVGQTYGLTRCRLVTPGRSVLADMHPTRINATIGSAKWKGKFPGGPNAATASGQVMRRYPISLAKGKRLRLEVIGPLRAPAGVAWPNQAGMGLIGIGALLVLWLVYRHFRSRLAGIGMVREALLARARGETAEPALAVAGNLGTEAAAWNEILDEHEHWRREATVQRAREGMNGGGAAAGDLAGGCDAMSQGLMLFDADRNVKYANNAAAVFMQQDLKALRSQHADGLLDDSAVRGAVEAAISGQARRREVCEVDQSEEGRGVLRFSIHPVRHQARSGAMVVIEDVTQQRVAERSRHDFVAQATHELRTPLTNIRLYLETAQDEGQDDPTIRAQALNVMNQETQRLERMVGDMLSVAQIEAGSLKLECDDVHLDELFASVDSHYQAQAGEKQLQFECKLPPKLPVIQADRDKLMMAVQNLVGNAMKYTPAGGRVTLNVETGEKQLTVEVADTGLGIAADDQAHLFDKFYRAKDRRIAGISGSGLGLALAREVVRLHGGEIAVESQVDQGSRFTIMLPITEAVAAGG